MIASTPAKRISSGCSAQLGGASAHPQVRGDRRRAQGAEPELALVVARGCAIVHPAKLVNERARAAEGDSIGGAGAGVGVDACLVESPAEQDAGLGPRIVRVPTARLAAAPLDPADVLDGAPVASILEIGSLGDAGYGAWEMTPRRASDTEADEVFVVLSGRASVELVHEGRVLELEPGDLVRLRAGERTVWTVHETLRKVYVAR